MLYRQVHGLPLFPLFLSYPLVINLYAPVMKTPQLSFSRIVRESGTTLVVTMGLYLVPGCTVALLPIETKHLACSGYIGHLPNIKEKGGKIYSINRSCPTFTGYNNVLILDQRSTTEFIFEFVNSADTCRLRSCHPCTPCLSCLHKTKNKMYNKSQHPIPRFCQFCSTSIVP